MSNKSSFKETPMDRMLAGFKTRQVEETEKPAAKPESQKSTTRIASKAASKKAPAPNPPKKSKPKVESSSSFSDDTDASSKIVMLNPNEIKPWVHADRPENEIVGIEELAEDIKTNGQSSPIIVRTLTDTSSSFKYEYIFGCRRLSATRSAGLKVKAVVYRHSDLSDVQAFALMHGENESRADLSPWAKSKSFRAALDDGLYPSQRKLSIALGKNEKYVKDLMIYEKIPNEIASAIGPMTHVSILTARALVNLSQDANNIPLLIYHAKEISTGHLSAKKLKKLVEKNSKSELPKKFSGKSGDILSLRFDSNGTPIFSLLKDAQKLLPPEELAQLIVNLFDEKFLEVDDV